VCRSSRRSGMKWQEQWKPPREDLRRVALPGHRGFTRLVSFPRRAGLTRARTVIHAAKRDAAIERGQRSRTRRYPACRATSSPRGARPLPHNGSAVRPGQTSPLAFLRHVNGIVKRDSASRQDPSVPRWRKSPSARRDELGRENRSLRLDVPQGANGRDVIYFVVRSCQSDAVFEQPTGSGDSEAMARHLL
jgi:hypothetical protein